MVGYILVYFVVVVFFGLLLVLVGVCGWGRIGRDS